MANEEVLDKIFKDARTHNGFSDTPVDDDLLRRVYDVMKWGPTSANCQPQRILFIKSKEAKERLRPALSEGNLTKTMAAPVTALLAFDSEFYEHLPHHFPHAPDAINWFKGKPSAEPTAFRNATLQGAYFIIAARAHGLDCGPMSGFDNGIVDKEFFPDGRFRSNFLCNLGYGNGENMFARSPRFTFDEVCQIL